MGVPTSLVQAFIGVMDSNPGGSARTPAVDIRSDTPGEVVSQAYGYCFFQPDHGGEEWHVDARWISTDPKAVRDAKAKAKGD